MKFLKDRMLDVLAVVLLSPFLIFILIIMFLGLVKVAIDWSVWRLSRE